MKKLLLETNLSKIYILTIILGSILIVGGYFSYAMFTVTKQKNNAISIVTGNLTYKLEVDGSESNTLTVPASSTKTFTVTLSNPNNRTARFNFYYKGDLPDLVTAGYRKVDGLNIPPDEVGINLSQSGASGSSNVYSIRVTNKSNNEISITLGVEVGLDYNDLTLPSNGHLFNEVVTTGLVSEIVIENLNNGSIYDDGVDTFIKGDDPNNYIWYSGKLWRAVSVNDSEKTTKIITEDDISSISYNEEGNSAFEGSYMKEWLNDTSVDGFLGNLRDYEKFIVTNSLFDATIDSTYIGSIERPNGTSVVNCAVGLLNAYEYQSSYDDNYENSYLNNGLSWYTLTPFSNDRVRYVTYNNELGNIYSYSVVGIRPVVNLKNDIKIIDGDGTEENPYRLEGDNDTNLSGTLLNTRYSGEYIKFGTGDNLLYRIVSHEEEGLTKIVSATPLISGNDFLYMAYDNNSSVNYSTNTTIGDFLNNTYLNTYLLTDAQEMIADNTTWYFGTIARGINYKLAKYADTDMSSKVDKQAVAKVGLLRIGELMAGQEIVEEIGLPYLTIDYWVLNPYSLGTVRYVDSSSYSADIAPANTKAVKPAFNIKDDVIIKEGRGTKNDPFILASN